MYLYFDRTGVLKEIINDESLRQGNYGINKMYIYIENRNYTSIDVSYVNSEGTIIGSQNHSTFTNPSATTPAVNCYIPYNPERDLKYFKYWTPYKFLIIDLEATTTESNDTEVDLGPGPLDVPGIVHCSLSANLETSDILQLGDVNFKVQPAPGLNNQVAPEHYLSLSNYLYLRSELNKKLELNDSDALQIAKNIRNISTLDGYGLQVYTSTAPGGLQHSETSQYKSDKITFIKDSGGVESTYNLSFPSSSGILATQNWSQQKLYTHEVWLRDDEATYSYMINILNASSSDLTLEQVKSHILQGDYTPSSRADVTEGIVNNVFLTVDTSTAQRKIYMIKVSFHAGGDNVFSTWEKEFTELTTIDEQFAREL